MTPATLTAPRATETYDENGVRHRPLRIITPVTIAMDDVLEMIPQTTLTPRQQPTGGMFDNATEMATQINVWQQTLRDVLERLPQLGGEWREREVRQAAVLALQIRALRPIFLEARQREAEAARRQRETQAAQEQRQQDELVEFNRLWRGMLGLDP